MFFSAVMATLPHFASVEDVQAYVDALKYESKPDGAWSPKVTVERGFGHCFGGALLGAAGLQALGLPAQLLYLETDLEVDDDHVIAVYQRDGLWGSVAKSNFTTLRGRLPVYASVRELVMSYFDGYFTATGVRSLTGYGEPIDLAAFEDRGPGHLGWAVAEDCMEDVDNALMAAPRHSVLPPALGVLTPAPKYLVNAALSDCNPDGLFQG